MSNQAPALACDADEPALDPDIIDRLERLGESIGEDLLGQLIVLFLADADRHLTELRHAIAVKTAGGVVRAAHSLSGASANLGAANLALLCTGLETAGELGDLATGARLLKAMEFELERVREALVVRISM
jgi:HPt (histidine-containing phosphotransfer) domain-containing protein